MKKRILPLAIAVMLLCILIPSASFTEDRDTILLAKSIYALARNESYETKIAIGSVVMNRLENPWFGETLREVLNEQHQFPVGNRYDADSLSAAHDVLAGRRNLSADALYYQASDASTPWNLKAVKTVGSYRFYAEDGNK